jgi:hypothetical protein
MEHTYFKKVNMPEMPSDIKKILDDAIAKAKVSDQDEGWVGKDKSFDYRQVTKDGKTVRSCRAHHNELPEEIKDWIRENVIPDWLYATLAVTHPVSDLHGMHTGRTRRYLLLHLIETGGDNVITRGFQQKGYPLARLAEGTNITIENYDDHEFELVDEMQIMPGDWVIFDTKVLHDVINITDNRVAIHLALDSNFDVDNWVYTNEPGEFATANYQEGTTK